MKDQYVGNVHDYRKYVLLRVLQSDVDIKLGVCWMLTPPERDGSSGAAFSYLSDVADRAWDPTVFDALRTIARDGTRSVAAIERSGLLDAVVYFDEAVPHTLQARRSWFERAIKALDPSDLIFFDPDVGLEIRSVPKGRKRSNRYVFQDEVAEAYRTDHSIVFYQHFPRQNRQKYLEDLTRRLREEAPKAEMWVFWTSDVAFALMIHPRHNNALPSAARRFEATYDQKFMAASRAN